jgi:hypothetical protein
MGMGIIKPQSELERKIFEVLLKNDFLQRLASDIQRYGRDILKLAYKLSPSQLGTMGLLGVRRLAQLRRDDPKKFEKVMKELEEVVGNE